MCFACSRKLDDKQVYTVIDGDSVCSSRCEQKAKSEKQDSAKETKISDFTW